MPIGRIQAVRPVPWASHSAVSSSQRLCEIRAPKAAKGQKADDEKKFIFFHIKNLVFRQISQSTRPGNSSAPAFSPRHHDPVWPHTRRQWLPFHLVGQDHHPIRKARIQLGQREDYLVVVGTGHQHIFGASRSCRPVVTPALLKISASATPLNVCITPCLLPYSLAARARIRSAGCRGDLDRLRKTAMHHQTAKKKKNEFHYLSVLGSANRGSVIKALSVPCLKKRSMAFSSTLKMQPDGLPLVSCKTDSRLGWPPHARCNDR